MGLIVLNKESKSMIRRLGYHEIIIDISFAFKELAVFILDWEVIENYLANHQYINCKDKGKLSDGRKEGIDPWIV